MCLKNLHGVFFQIHQHLLKLTIHLMQVTCHFQLLLQALVNPSSFVLLNFTFLEY